jgi:AraC-like DNA-binding protein
MRLTMNRGVARWSYEVLEPQVLGRQKNEILALGYMVDLVRCFAGRRWIPSRVDVPGPALPARARVEALLQCEIGRGDQLSVTFASALLEAPGQRRRVKAAGSAEVGLPDWQDLPGSVRELIRLGLLSQRPSSGWVASHLGIPVRTMQRHLNEHQTRFGRMVQETILDLAQELLRRKMSITELAVELGYSDPAHLTRAFRRALGVAPREWRRLNVTPGTLDTASP